MKKILFKNDFRFWRILINSWTLVFFIMIIADFSRHNAYENVLNAVSTIYIGLLAIYVSNKEFERWYDRHEESHPGEIFVLIWTIIMVGLFLLDFIFNGHYHVPNAVISSYIAVLTILVITRKSKELYKLKRGGKR